MLGPHGHSVRGGEPHVAVQLNRRFVLSDLRLFAGDREAAAAGAPVGRDRDPHQLGGSVGVRQLALVGDAHVLAGELEPLDHAPRHLEHDGSRIRVDRGRNRRLRDTPLQREPDDDGERDGRQRDDQPGTTLPHRHDEFEDLRI